MAKASKDIRTTTNMKEISKVGKPMAKGFMPGLMEKFTMESGKTESKKATVSGKVFSEILI